MGHGADDLISFLVSIAALELIAERTPEAGGVRNGTSNGLLKIVVHSTTRGGTGRSTARNGDSPSVFIE